MTIRDGKKPAGTPNWSGEERRAHPVDEAMIELIAEKAAERAVAKLTGHIYQEIGKGVVAKILWVAGVLAAALWLFLQQKGAIK